jgi:uncharacterized protein
MDFSCQDVGKNAGTTLASFKALRGKTMEQRMSIVTVGVSDLTRSKRFYSEVLGWKPVDGDNEIAFYNVGSIWLALYPNSSLANDVNPSIDAAETPSGGFRGFTLSQNLGSRAEVDALFATLSSAGVTILKEPHEVFWGGYSGYFADPDGNPWEVAHNPYWENDETGTPVLPS